MLAIPESEYMKQAAAVIEALVGLAGTQEDSKDTATLLYTKGHGTSDARYFADKDEDIAVIMFKPGEGRLVSFQKIIAKLVEMWA